MKEKLLKFIDVLIKMPLRFKLTKEVEYSEAYSSLSPIDNGDEDGHYSKALLWALKNRSRVDIKNIALTGPYGSGKSSILKTFQKNYKENDLKFLNLSLATFEEEKPELDNNGKKIKVDKTDLLRRIEISILEQIFYHEEDEKIPDSRFKKIKSYSNKKLILFSSGFFLFLIAFIIYFNPLFIQSIFKCIVITHNMSVVIHYICVFIIALGTIYLIFKSIRIISAITINKLKIQNAEIGIGENINKSILNHHIDEILYFFSIRPYNVVIIEDLDRFQETEIFTKLREVNLLLNKSEKTKHKEIVFVYAVRDDMFTDKERTKFFDFIIPVIPIINSSNSSEILLKKKNQFDFNLSDNLIEDLSFYIDDMRLLHNISNEFYLYKEKLNETLKHDKLFAIITYKNIYPNDFMQLSCNKGILYSIFNSKTTFIKKIVDELNLEIENYSLQISDYENLFISNIKDIRLLYVIRIIEKLPGFKSFIINNSALSINEVIEENNFEYLKTDNYSYHQMVVDSFNRPSVRNQELSSKFTEIEKIVDNNKTYSEKEIEILDIKSGKIFALKNKIQELEKKKQSVRNSTIAELLDTDQINDIDVNNNINIALIGILLRNRYIEEDYLDYITLFHEESITRSDYQFHLGIKNKINQPFDFKLSKIEKLILKINTLDFQREYILNYDLLDYMLLHYDKYYQLLVSIINKIKDESKISTEFIIGYFDVSKKLDLFINLLSKKWPNIWGFIESNSQFSEELKKTIFKNIIEFTDSNDIFALSKHSSFKSLILSDPLFLNITHSLDKLKSVIEELNIEFNQIDFENSSTEMLTFIYEENYYKLNVEMLVSIIKKFGEFHQVEFDNSNYYAIKSSKAEGLIDNVENNINEYIKDVYLKIKTNVNEKEEYFVDLLNNDDIAFENLVSIISQVETKVSNLSKIDNQNLFSILLSKNKLIPNWENLLLEYNRNLADVSVEEDRRKIKISQSIIDFINIPQNAEALSKIKLQKTENTDDIFVEFWKKLIQIDEVDDNSYALILKSSSWRFGDLSLDNLSESKIKFLIINNCISPSVNNFNLVKEKYFGLNIYFLELRKMEYFNILHELDFDSGDLELILKSTNLNNAEKLKILNYCPDEAIMLNYNLKLLSSILVEENYYEINDNILSLILLNNQIPAVERIKLYINSYDKFNPTFVVDFLKNLGEYYADINDTSLKAKIPKNQVNKNLLSTLLKMDYISSYSEKELIYRVNHKRK